MRVAALLAALMLAACNSGQSDWCLALNDLRDRESGCPQVLDGGPYLVDAGFIYAGCEAVLSSSVCQVDEREALAAAGTCLSALPTCEAGQDQAYNALVAACLLGDGGFGVGDAGSPVPALNATCAENLYGAGAL